MLKRPFTHRMMKKSLIIVGIIGIAITMSGGSILKVSSQSVNILKFSLWGIQSQDIRIDPTLIESYELIHTKSQLAKRPVKVYNIKINCLDGRGVIFPHGLVSSTKRDKVEGQMRKIENSINGKRIVRISFTLWPFTVFSIIVLAVGLMGWKPIIDY